MYQIIFTKRYNGITQMSLKAVIQEGVLLIFTFIINTIVSNVYKRASVY